jgi:RNase P subunit RPR2
VTIEVRNAEGPRLKWTRARVAELCDECLDPIAPGDEMVRYDDEFVTSTGHGHIPRTYCKSCGELLQDSLVTEEGE